jgi:hypothetical protein
VKRRLLRIEERLEQRRVELAHDVLCAPIRAAGVEREATAQKRRAEENWPVTSARRKRSTDRGRRLRGRNGRCWSPSRCSRWRWGRRHLQLGDGGEGNER